MTIKTRLLFNTVASIGLTCILALLLYASFQQITDEVEKQTTANNLVHKTTDLIIVTEDYLAFHYPRSEQQWQVTHTEILNLLEQNPVLLQSAGPILEQQEHSFSKIKSLYEEREALIQSNAAADEIDRNLILEERLSAHMRLTSREIMSLAFYIFNSAQSNVISITYRNTLIIMGFVVFMIVAAFIGAYFTTKNIITPLNELMLGAVQIEKGDFSHTFGPLDQESHIHPGDEIGKLAVSFDSMTRKLVGSLEKLEVEIEERGRIEQELRDSEEKYRTLFENMAQGVFYQQADGILVDNNSAALEMFGMTQDQFLGKTSMDPNWRVIHEDGSDFPGEQHPSMEALRTGKPISDAIAGIFNPHKEDFVWLSINAIPQFKTGEDKPYQVFVTLHDITDLKQAEEALREREQNFRDMVENFMDGVAIADENGHHIYVNSKFSEITAYRKDELLNMTGWDLTRSEDRVKLQQKMKNRMVGQPHEKHYERIILRKDGKKVITEMATNITHWQGKQRPIAIIRDITERKQAEEELQKYRDHLEELVEERTEKLNKMVNLMAGREVRMAELKQVIKRLRNQLEASGIEPVANDPLLRDQL